METIVSIEEESDRREGKHTTSLLFGGLLCFEWRFRHLAARMIWRKVFGRASVLGGGLVWCEPSDHPFFRSIHSAKCTFFYSSFSSNHPGAKSLVWQGIEWIPSPAISSDDLCLLFYLYPSSMIVSVYFCVFVVRWPPVLVRPSGVPTRGRRAGGGGGGRLVRWPHYCCRHPCHRLCPPSLAPPLKQTWSWIELSGGLSL